MVFRTLGYFFVVYFAQPYASFNSLTIKLSTHSESNLFRSKLCTSRSNPFSSFISKFIHSLKIAFSDLFSCMVSV